MEGLCAFVLERATFYPSFSFNEKSDKLDVSEIWSSHTPHEIQRTQIRDDDVELWLNKKYSDNPALLRFVWVRLRKEVQPWQLNIRKSSLYVILEYFEIKEAFKYGFASPGNFALIPVHQTEQSNILVFSLSMLDLFAVAWKYDIRTERTEAIFWAHEWVTVAMQDLMSQKKAWARHPLFLALIVSVMLGCLLDRDLDRECRSISAVENRTRYHGFKHTSVGVAEGDYAFLSQKMSGCAVSLAGSERIHSIIIEYLHDISLYSERYCANDDPRSRAVNLEADKCVETLKRRSKMQKIQIDYLSRRVGFQLTALFNLIAQKEAKVGIAVAEDSRTLASASKEDSTAMKTLAAVTVAFLPGTFVAAFFAMPLFDWDAVGDGTVVSERFWVYWAVTVPLTVVTLVVWVFWTKRQARMHRVSEKRAREELRDDIEIVRVGGVEAKGR